MKTIDIMTKIEEYLATNERAYLTRLLDELDKEYRLEEAKKNGGMNAVRRKKTVEKILKRNQKELNTRIFDKMFLLDINGEEKQVVGGLYYTVFLNKDYFVDLPVNDNSEKLPNYQSLLPSFRNTYSEIKFDIAEIKKELAKWKAEQKEKTKAVREERCILSIGNMDTVGFNAEYFIAMYDVLSGEGEVKFYQNQLSNGISYFESKVGIALICPVKKIKK